jgi:coproporphyrinogen III oxidase-like Fe-S oxidoreductase
MMVEQFIARFIRKKTAECFAFDNTGAVAPPEPPSRPIQLYVHIPFCAELCPYCSFHRVLFREDTAREYFTSLRKELAMYHEKGYSFSEVYIGGGTPTILFDELLSLLRLVGEKFSPSEISVETNPDRLDADTLKTLSHEGVKRVSVGIQTFDDGILRSVGRLHKYGSGDTLRQRLSEARGYVHTLNADMIYNFPVQSRDMLLKDLETLMDIGLTRSPSTHSWSPPTHRTGWGASWAG